MAHGRKGPDVVMNIRYVGASDVRAVSEHEKYRTPDGSSAIDPLRSHLNEILVGPQVFDDQGRPRPSTQQDALDALYASGVKKPATQAEAPYVQMVLSASPEFFRRPGEGPGSWDPEKLEQWKIRTMDWLRSEYGQDLIHVSLHLDEDTPHLRRRACDCRR